MLNQELPALAAVFIDPMQGRTCAASCRMAALSGQARRLPMPSSRESYSGHVLSVRKYAEAKDRVVLNTLDQSGVTHGVPLSLPKDILDKAIIVIAERLPMTLGELGELNV